MSKQELLGQFGRNAGQTLELLYGDDIQGVVHVFATTTARDALPTAAWRTGELCHIEATDAWFRWTGSAWVSYTGFGGGSGGGGVGFPYSFLTSTADSDPGAGSFKFDNATFASITKIFINRSAATGGDVTTWLASIDSTIGVIKGLLWYKSSASPTKWGLFKVTGSRISGTGYDKFNLTPVAQGAGGFPSTTAADTTLTFDALGMGQTIVDADISTIAGMAYAKLAAGTAGRVLTINASGVVVESDTVLGSKTFQHSAADALGAILTLFSTRGTSASPTANNALDILGEILAQGYDGSAPFNAGSIKFKVISAAGTSKRAQAESTIHDGTAEVTTGTFQRFPRTPTTDATVTKLAEIDIPADSTVEISFSVHGHETSPGTTNIAHRKTSLTVFRIGTGNVNEMSHSDSVALSKTDGSWGDENGIGYFLNTSTQKVEFRGQGKVGANVTWTGEASHTVY